MSKEQRQSSKLWEPKSFNIYKNTAVPIIAMLGHPGLDTEVSDTDMKTAESNNCRRMSRRNRDTNGVLAAIQEGARFFYKDGWKFINPFT